MTLLAKKFVFRNLFFVLFIFNNLQEVILLQCKNEQNQDVDWFVAYKIPKMSESKNHLINKGVAYVHMDSTSFHDGWTLSHKDICSTDSLFGNTLAPFYNDHESKENMWFLYNDQPPNEPAKMYNGHTKGTVMVNENKGFWLIHSVPNFPPEPEHGEDRGRRKLEDGIKSTEISKLKVHNLTIGKYNYPSTGKKNGQSFLCISIDRSDFDTIGKQLMYNQIIVYKKNLPHDLSKKFPLLTDAANEVKIKKGPYNNKVQFHSANGMEFTSFAKSSKWNKDLYDDFVAPELNSNLYTETWLNGPGRLPSDCSKSRVFNVQNVQLSKAQAEFKSSTDHSKWAVSANDDGKGSWVCVGDINRASTQFERGGGTVCFNRPEVWKNYVDAIKGFEPCPKKQGIISKVKSWFGSWFSSAQ